MALIKNGTIVDDRWLSVDDETDLSAYKGDVIVGLERWQTERALLLERSGQLGLHLKSDQSPEIVENDLDCFDVIALEFPAFKDGRAYSYARILRERYGYEGELRAVGDVLRDQFLFMHRCGFDTYEVIDENLLHSWREALDEISVFYQSASDERNTVLELRHRKREAAE